MVVDVIQLLQARQRTHECLLLALQLRRRARVLLQREDARRVLRGLAVTPLALLLLSPRGELVDAPSQTRGLGFGEPMPRPRGSLRRGVREPTAEHEPAKRKRRALRRNAAPPRFRVALRALRRGTERRPNERVARVAFETETREPRLDSSTEKPSVMEKRGAVSFAARDSALRAGAGSRGFFLRAEANARPQPPPNERIPRLPRP